MLEKRDANARRKTDRSSQHDRLCRDDAAGAMAGYDEPCADDARWQAELWRACTQDAGWENSRPFRDLGRGATALHRGRVSVWMFRRYVGWYSRGIYRYHHGRC